MDIIITTSYYQWERGAYMIRSKILNVFRGVFTRERQFETSKTQINTIRIDASSICQLRCTGCGFQKSNGRELGYGYLTLEHFIDFIDKNPQITRVELSNYGEIFLNPDLIEIMAYAHKKGVALEAAMGVNFNTVSEDQMQALVKYEFRFLSFSIDGASQESYSKYRIGGDFDRVISNVKRLQDLKKQCGADYPKLQWQFVPNEYNEDEVSQAKAMATEIGIPIVFKLNFISSYKPNNPQKLKEETGLTEVTREEYLEKNEIPYLNDDCLQVFYDPQFNWDGMLLGCCRNEWAFFKSNLFVDGLEKCLQDDDFQRMRTILKTKNPSQDQMEGIPCKNCAIWKSRQKYGKAFHPGN